MAIILEGFDNSGKSTLAKRLGLQIIHAGGAPKTDEQLQQYLVDQAKYADQAVVLDRVSCISHQVYGNNMLNSHLMKHLRDFTCNEKVVLVYCRPPTEVMKNFGNHIIKDHDSMDHLEDIMRNAQTYIDRYDGLMACISHVKYDYTRDGDNEEFIKALMFSQVHNG